MAACEASRIESTMLGYGCTVFVMSSQEAENSIARVASAMSSEALVAIIWMPSILSVLAQLMIFIIPLALSVAIALGFIFSGNTPIFMVSPIDLIACSVWPTHAISGSVWITLGITS